MPGPAVYLRVRPRRADRTIWTDPEDVECAGGPAGLHRVTLLVALGEETDRVLRHIDGALHIDEYLVGTRDVHEHRDVIVAGGVRVIDPQHQLLPRELIGVHTDLVAHPGQVWQLLEHQTDRARVPGVDRNAS